LWLWRGLGRWRRFLDDRRRSRRDRRLFGDGRRLRLDARRLGRRRNFGGGRRFGRWRRGRWRFLGDGGRRWLRRP
jgi:hypothetical protein